MMLIDKRCLLLFLPTYLICRTDFFTSFIRYLDPTVESRDCSFG